MKGTCEICGNTYDKAFEVIAENGDRHVFDSFECAIQGLAPVCPSCETRIVGHGVEADSKIYCSAHCARQEGLVGLVDRK